MMPGVSFEEIRNQIVDAYTYSELETVLRERMNVRLDRVVAPSTFDHVVFQLLGWSERFGREVELIRVAARARLEHPGMQSVYQKYGMAVPVFLQQAGAPAHAAPLPASDGGFQAAVNALLPLLDVRGWREQLAAMEGRVCRVEVGNGAMGTGFLVGPDAVLTNYHVLQSVLDGTNRADRVRCRFDYQLLADGRKVDGTPLSLHATNWRIDHSEYSPGEANNQPDNGTPTPDQLDYALVRLERPIGSEALDSSARPGAATPLRGWIRVPGAEPALTPNMPIFILQHPNQEPLKLAFDTRGVINLNANGSRVRYATNTLGGSSGSPCFDVHWNLIALHHYGDPACGHPPQWNQGIPIWQIRQRVQRQPALATVLGGEPPR